MLRSVAAKVAWVGRTAAMVFGLALVLALVAGVTTTALGATGDNFILGVLTNKASSITRLTGNVAGKPALHIVNPNTGAGSKALQLTVADKKAPLSVNAVGGGTPGKALNLDADKVDGKEAADFLGKTEKAQDADVLDGKDSSEFANAAHTHPGADITSGTVAEARIDGAIARDSEVSNGYIQGRGLAQHGARAYNPGENEYFLRMSNPDLWVSYECRSLTSNGFIGIKNASATETVNAFSDNGEQNPSYRQLVPGEFWSQGAAANGEHITFQVQGNTYVATIEVFSVHRTSDNKCHVQAQALVTKP